MKNLSFVKSLLKSNEEISEINTKHPDERMKNVSTVNFMYPAGMNYPTLILLIFDFDTNNEIGCIIFGIDYPEKILSQFNADFKVENLKGVSGLIFKTDEFEKSFPNLLFKLREIHAVKGLYGANYTIPVRIDKFI